MGAGRKGESANPGEPHQAEENETDFEQRRTTRTPRRFRRCRLTGAFVPTSCCSRVHSGCRTTASSGARAGAAARRTTSPRPWWCFRMGEASEWRLRKATKNCPRDTGSGNYERRNPNLLEGLGVIWGTTLEVVDGYTEVSG